MLNVGMTELLVFGILALLILGPDKLPEAARFAGTWYAKIKRMISNVQHDIDRELRMSELREQMQNEMKKIQELELKMQAQMHQLQQQDILATAKTTEEASTDNKNPPATYQFIGVAHLEPKLVPLRTQVYGKSSKPSVENTLNTFKHSNDEFKVAV